jgi:hypothetical protein
MLDVRRLPSALVAATFALSGVVGVTGVTSVALGVSQGESPICSGIEEDRPARGILGCLGPSTAYVESALGSGSGLVLPGGYLLTNAHVVDPFDKVDVTLGEDKHTAVPVVGVDLFADIAVLGPIETDAPAVHLTDPAELLEGDQLFLVGYPGEVTADDLRPTIADGILSRTRHSKVFDLNYLQTDASIGGGQSGGALVDIDGGVVGISSLRFAENFALALSGADAQSAVDRILAGKGSAYQPWPGGEAVSQTTLHLPRDYAPEFISVPDAAEERTIDITIPSDLPVVAVSATMESDDDLQTAGNLIAIAAEELDVPQSYLAGATREELTQFMDEDIDMAEELSPGVFRFRVPAGEHMVIVFLTNREAGLDLPITASLPIVSILPDAPIDSGVGTVVDATVGALMPYDTYNITLTKGQAIEIYAGSPAGDMRVLVKAPGEGSDEDAEEFDDSEVGLYGLDVEEVFTAEVDGLHTIEVGQVSDSATGYHFEIREPS